MKSKLCLNCMSEKKHEDAICHVCGVASVSANEPWHLQPGCILKERYLIGRSIGYGGFGVTYIAFDLILQLKVAIKEYLPSEFATRMPGVTRVSVYAGQREEQFKHGLDGFIKEARKLAKFTEHRGIVKIQEFFEENHTAYLVMEYIEGQTLKGYLESQGGKIGFDQSLNILMPVIDALGEVHKAGIIHRDISPDNILITKNMEVKLIDFGAARYAITDDPKSLSVILKPGYAPEEQYRTRGNQGPWTDIYAVGATLYRMITGIVPEEALQRVIEDKVKKPSDFGVDYPHNAEIALMNAMAIKAYNRYQTMEEFREYITGNKEATIIDREDEVQLSRNKKKKRKRLAYISTTILVVITIALGIYIGTKRLTQTIGIEQINEVNTPDIIGKTKDEGRSILEAKELGFLIVDKENSKRVTKDRIMKQAPKSGIISQKGDIIEVVISAGKKLIEMKDVNYMMKEIGIDWLEDQGFDIDIIDVEDDYGLKGQIVGQRIKRLIGNKVKPGEEVEVGSLVEVKVAKGKKDREIKQVKVPDITNINFKEAIDILHEIGLPIVKVGEEYSSKVKAGNIISQDQQACATITTDIPINVIISAGKELIKVPDIQYKAIEEVITILEEQKLIVKVTYELSKDVIAGKVISQSIEAGTKVEPGTEISIVVSKGKQTDEIDVIVKKSDNVDEEEDNFLKLGEEWNLQVEELIGLTPEELETATQVVEIIESSNDVLDNVNYTYLTQKGKITIGYANKSTPFDNDRNSSNVTCQNIRILEQDFNFEGISKKMSTDEVLSTLGEPQVVQRLSRTIIVYMYYMENYDLELGFRVGDGLESIFIDGLKVHRRCEEDNYVDNIEALIGLGKDELVFLMGRDIKYGAKRLTDGSSLEFDFRTPTGEEGSIWDKDVTVSGVSYDGTVSLSSYIGTICTLDGLSLSSSVDQLLTWKGGPDYIKEGTDGTQYYFLNNNMLFEITINSEDIEKLAVYDARMEIYNEISELMTRNNTNDKTIDRIDLFSLNRDGWHVFKNMSGESVIVKGDLNKDGIEDIAAIIEQMSQTEGAPPRALFIAFGNEEGAYTPSILAEKAISRADEGGVWGDPLDGISINRGSILLSFYGGSNWRWYSRYRFRYQDNDWYLIGATLGSYFTGNSLEDEEIDYNLLTGDYIEKKADEEGNIQSTKGNRGKSPLLKLKDFDIHAGSDQFLN